jgi:Secretion system C-terminal sorting domain
MEETMKTISCILLLVADLFFPSSGYGQRGVFTPGGLSGRIVYSLALWGNKVYAGTDDGVFVHTVGQFDDTVWTPVGLRGRTVRSVYPHQSGAIGYAISAGIDLRFGDSDSVLIYCSQNSDSAWIPADDGIDRSSVRVIKCIDGFPSPLICGESYAASEGLVYRRSIGGIWEKVFDMGIVVTNVVKVNSTTVSVWTGGETAIFWPFISRSHDKGNTWSTSFPDLQGDNACNSLAFDPGDTSVVYAGMEGSVIVSKDEGTSWQSSGLGGTPFYFSSLVVTPSSQTVYAGGVAHGSTFGLYSAGLHDTVWREITPPKPYAGIMTILSLPAVQDSDRLLLGTFGDGVIQFHIPVTSIQAGSTPSLFTLHQNYPNPFNPTTTIEFTLPRAASVSLRVFNVLGEEMASLVAGDYPAGIFRTTWDASAFPSGVYLYRLTAGPSVQTKKMILTR